MLNKSRKVGKFDLCLDKIAQAFSFNICLEFSVKQGANVIELFMAVIL
jgi:hypothetical protein